MINEEWVITYQMTSNHSSVMSFQQAILTALESKCTNEPSHVSFGEIL